MKLFFRYLKTKALAITVLIVCILIYAAVLALYSINLKTIVYPSVLCIVFVFGAFIVDFLKVRSKHRVLNDLKTHTADIIDTLPSSDSIMEDDYRELLFILKKNASELGRINEARYSDMIEYYTLWAHQIKTPISSMKLILQSEDSSLSRSISSDLFRIEQYVEMVLTYLRLDSDSGDYVFKKYPLDKIIRNAVVKYASEFINRKIALEYDTIEKTVTTDEKWLSFVIEQILSNSLKYTKEGSIKIYLDDSDTLCIKDTGIGIASSDLPRIFEKGFTGYNGRANKSSSGIGLYLCKRICQKLGIDISIDSTVSQGTVVKLNLSEYKLNIE